MLSPSDLANLTGTALPICLACSRIESPEELVIIIKRLQGRSLAQRYAAMPARDG